MKLTCDIRSELVDEPLSHVSKAGKVDVQWQVPPAFCFGRGIPERPALACLAGIGSF